MKIQLGSADWNLWPISTDYALIFPIFKRLGISHLELGIYEPSVELTPAKQSRILALAADSGLTITAALFSLTPERWPQGAFSNSDSVFLRESLYFLDALTQMKIPAANIWTGADLPNSDLFSTQLTLSTLNRAAEGFPGIVSIEYKADTIFPDGATLAQYLQPLSRLKVLIDTGHAFALEEDIVHLIGDLHSKNLLGSLHLGDAVAGDSDADLPCGRVHDFTPILNKLHSFNYQGVASFDLYGAAIDESGPGPEAILSESHRHLASRLDQVGND